MYLTSINEHASDLVKVVNVNGSSQHPTDQKGNTWKDHWIQGTGKLWPSECCACGKKTTLVGAHVHLLNADRKQYIVPLCQKCNKRDDAFIVNKKFLVEVNID